MNTVASSISLRLPERVKNDTRRYRTNLSRFLKGIFSEADFTAYRKTMGIYEQRQSGWYMVRVRIGAGMASTAQLTRIAELSCRFGRGVLHVTTRQDIQIHDVKIEDTANLLEELQDAGLCTRGGGGDTVRNVTSCPRSGVCPDEKFDVRPFAIAVAEYLLASSSSYALPRKFKIAFSGCGLDCSLGSVTDVGFFAHVENDAAGFSVYAGGGLGANPAMGIKIEDFVHSDEILEVVESLKQIFDREGDRTNRREARLRYVVSRVGREKFIELYHQQRKELSGKVPKIDLKSCRCEPENIVESTGENESEPNVMPEKRKGFYTVEIKLHLGQITAEELMSVCELAEKFAAGDIRTSQTQNLLITSVAKENVNTILEKINSLESTEKSGAKFVTCTGAGVCRLGLCNSRALVNDVMELFEKKNIDASKLPLIRVSGCPNSCANHQIAALSFQGRIKRVDGEPKEFYDCFVNGNAGEGNVKFAERIGTFAAKDIPDILTKWCKDGRQPDLTVDI
ncbi:MAG: nitrite/sulfite reductase [Phycisphaerae bacterium]|nr:nitrite/sulfite reductase [Phycisphaerae bacterium]